MGKYNVTLHYDAHYSVTVEANDEGEAYEKARNLAENADMNEFILGIEHETSCEGVGR